MLSHHQRQSAENIQFRKKDCLQCYIHIWFVGRHDVILNTVKIGYVNKTKSDCPGRLLYHCETERANFVVIYLGSVTSVRFV